MVGFIARVQFIEEEVEADKPLIGVLCRKVETVVVVSEGPQGLARIAARQDIGIVVVLERTRIQEVNRKAITFRSD